MHDELGDIVQEYRVFDLACALVAERARSAELARKYDELARAHLDVVVTLEKIEAIVSKRHS